jgi:hypothetical protein
MNYVCVLEIRGGGGGRGHYNNLRTTSENKIKIMWNIINSESGKGTPTERKLLMFKYENNNIHPNQASEVFNKYYIILIDRLNINSMDTCSAMSSLVSSIPSGFPKMITVPIKETELKGTITSLNFKNSSG